MTLGRRPGPGPGGLVVDADLVISIDDGAGHDTHARLATATAPSGTGAAARVLCLSVDRPQIALAALPRNLLDDRTGRGELLDALARAGWRAELRGPDRLLAVLDPTRPHRLARLVTGSPWLNLTLPGARAAAVVLLPARALSTTSGVAALLGLAVLAGFAVRRRHR